ncbi:hypothetical protein [Rugamonas sp. DEMB1]|uniref:hypothetical protein n=1 Tax=Rugamonas sp. DEMB1 TaxID=3039386 RepID=UPI00244CA2C0|nr:hypothetical protein [Rugamonas sp. DEMB1]WGG51739.1 hypothetical protein QC826_05810 [Rugamonas sp. DEMB1]
MKKKLSFDLGNRDLFPEEEAIIGIVEDALLASAKKHGLWLKPGVLAATTKRPIAAGALGLLQASRQEKIARPRAVTTIAATPASTTVGGDDVTPEKKNRRTASR